MVKIICNTKEEKEQFNKLLRLVEFTILGSEIIMQADIPCLDRKDIKWEINEDDMASTKKKIILKLEKLRPNTCIGNSCYEDCELYANGAYGTGRCALDIVIGEIERRNI